jgi:hypothetical protein
LTCPANLIVAGLAALVSMDVAVAFDQASLVELGFLKVAVHIADIDEVALWHGLAPPLCLRKTAMRHGLAIQPLPVSVESPG